MKELLDIPMMERWSALVERLPRFIASQFEAKSCDPSDEVPVGELAARHEIGERAMVNRLKTLGGKPYQLGGRWFIRRVSLITALESAEAEGSKS